MTTRRAIGDVRVALDVRRDVAHPARGAGARIRQVNRAERGDRLRLAVFEDREVRGGQALHRPAIAVEHRDVEVDQIHAGSKLRRRLR